MRIVFNAVDSFPKEPLARNKASALGHFASITGSSGIQPKLAVVGGGPSVADHVQDLRDWDGSIWAINGAWKWCHDLGIKTSFYSLDPTPNLIEEGWDVSHAILADQCDPTTFGTVNGAVEVFRVGSAPNGSTSASTAPMIAAMRGHESVTLFGCDSSFADKVHVYAWDEPSGNGRLLISCGGKEYLTNPQMLMQAEYLAEIGRAVPSYVSAVGYGLLPALIEHGDYDVLAVSKDIEASLK